MNRELLISNRTRSTPFTSRVEACGVKAYTVYNHMLLPAIFRSLEEDYWHLCEAVQVWDVSCQRQVEIIGKDALKLVQLMTPRDLSKAENGQCFYAPLCDETGGMINDPILIKHSNDHWWLSIADTDVMLWAKGLTIGFGLDVSVSEPDIWPLAIQGPKSKKLLSRIFDEKNLEMGFFRGKFLSYKECKMFVARSGWSKQGGFEIYINDREIGLNLWDELFEKGKNLNVGPGCPNLIERIESGLLSFGGDMNYENTPFECGLDQYVDLEADINCLSLEALKKREPKTQLIGLLSKEKLDLKNKKVFKGKHFFGEITSNVWSPRYSRHLCIASCKLKLFKDSSTTYVQSSNKNIEVEVTNLPFDFKSLGLLK